MRRATAVAFLLAAVLLVGVPPPLSAQASPSPGAKGDLVFFGTRADGNASGISAARLDPRTGTLTPLGLVAEATRPTWLLASPHRPILYAVKEVGNDGKTEGGVTSFAIDMETGRLTATGSVGSGGGGATFLAITAQQLPPALLVANYGTGDIGVVPLGQAGVPGAVVSTQRDVGSGPTPRQASAHPHGIAFDPTGRHALVADLGADRIFVYRYDPASGTLSPGKQQSLAVPPASGPRHIIFHPNGRFVYANAELTGEVLVFGWDAASATLRLLKVVPTRSAGYAGALSSAEIVPSSDGRFLYISNRGEDVLMVFGVDAATGDLSLVQRIASGGKAPASFAFDPRGRWLVVANEGSNRVSVFSRDAGSGRLTPTGGGLPVTDPTSVAFLTP